MRDLHQHTHLHAIYLRKQLRHDAIHDAATVAAPAARGGQRVELVEEHDAGAGAARARKHLQRAVCRKGQAAEILIAIRLANELAQHSTYQMIPLNDPLPDPRILHRWQLYRLASRI